MALTSKTDLVEARASLREWLRRRRPTAKELELSDVTAPAASGFSNETLFFEATWREDGAQHRQGMVARLQATGPGLYPDYDIERQYRLLQILAEQSDVPVPSVLQTEDDTLVLGTPFFVMERLEGRVPGDDPAFTAEGWVLDLPTPERGLLADNALQALAKVHAVDCEALNLDFLVRAEEGADALEREIAYFERYYEWAANGSTYPTVEGAFEWVRTHRPTAQEEPVVLSWGDSRIGNIMFGEDLSVVGVLDWEMATLGPAGLDLGWWLFMHRHHTEGYGMPHPEGFPRRDEIIARYEQLTGRPVRHIDFYETFAALRGAVIMVRLVELMTEARMLPADSEMRFNNPVNRILAELVGLPEPVGVGLTGVISRGGAS